MDVPCEMLLHPELLTNEQLIYILRQRQLRIPDIHKMPRDELLDLFHHYCVPFGQRKYRDSGRGKVLNKSRNMSPENKPKLNVMNINNNQNRKSQAWTNERLKPPPDLLAGHMKRIKLESISVTHKDFINCKRKMSIESMTPATDCPPHKKEKKPITWP